MFDVQPRYHSPPSRGWPKAGSSGPGFFCEQVVTPYHKIQLPIQSENLKIPIGSYNWICCGDRIIFTFRWKKINRYRQQCRLDRKEDAMNSCTPALDRSPVTMDRTRSIQLPVRPQWHILMCRARWLVTPCGSDAPASVESCPTRWLGPAKVLLWMAISIGIGLCLGGLSG